MNYSPAFLFCDGVTEIEEGGWANHPYDKGKATAYGISQAAHPEVNVSRLTPEGAREIRHRCYWVPIRGDELPLAVALALYDWCIHSADPRYASWVEKIAQKTVNAVPDGDFGPRTIEAVRLYCESHSALELAGELMRERLDAWARGFKIGLFAPKMIAGIERPLEDPVRVQAGLWCLRGFMQRARRISMEISKAS